MIDFSLFFLLRQQLGLARKAHSRENSQTLLVKTTDLHASCKSHSYRPESLNQGTLLPPREWGGAGFGPYLEMILIVISETRGGPGIYYCRGQGCC